MLERINIKGQCMATDEQKKKDNKNIIFVSMFIGVMLQWMLAQSFM